jgi:hypothetical protein
MTLWRTAQTNQSRVHDLYRCTLPPFQQPPLTALALAVLDQNMVLLPEADRNQYLNPNSVPLSYPQWMN